MSKRKSGQTVKKANGHHEWRVVIESCFNEQKQRVHNLCGHRVTVKEVSFSERVGDEEDLGGGEAALAQVPYCAFCELEPISGIYSDAGGPYQVTEWK